MTPPQRKAARAVAVIVVAGVVLTNGDGQDLGAVSSPRQPNRDASR